MYHVFSGYTLQLSRYLWCGTQPWFSYTSLKCYNLVGVFWLKLSPKKWLTLPQFASNWLTIGSIWLTLALKGSNCLKNDRRDIFMLSYLICPGCAKRFVHVSAFCLTDRFHAHISPISKLFKTNSVQCSSSPHIYPTLLQWTAVNSRPWRCFVYGHFISITRPQRIRSIFSIGSWRTKKSQIYERSS